jgi:hypothetical protein
VESGVMAAAPASFSYFTVAYIAHVMGQYCNITVASRLRPVSPSVSPFVSASVCHSVCRSVCHSVCLCCEGQCASLPMTWRETDMI